MPDRIKVGVEYEAQPDAELRALGITTPHRDTIWLTEEEYGGQLNASAINRMKAGQDPTVNIIKAARIKEWKDRTLHPPAPEPVVELDPRDVAREAVARAQEALDAANLALQATAVLADEVTPDSEV